MRDDVKLVFPNPKTSGNGRYTYLAARGAANQADGNDPAKTRAFMTRFLKNVLVFDTGGRGATTTFVERGLGDVLISFESEVNNIRKQYGEDKYEVIVPPVDILAEFPVASGRQKRRAQRYRTGGQSLSELSLQPGGAAGDHQLLLPRV